MWVVGDLREDGKLQWKADSDSQLTKVRASVSVCVCGGGEGALSSEGRRRVLLFIASPMLTPHHPPHVSSPSSPAPHTPPRGWPQGLAALLVQGLSGCTPEEVVRIQPDFIELLGLQQSLTPSRNNGFLNMFKLMQKRALDLYMQQQQQLAAGGGGSSAAAAASERQGAAAGAAPPSAAAAGSSNSSGGSGGGSSDTPVADSMRAKLEAELAPLKLDIVDNSYQHAGHSGEPLPPEDSCPRLAPAAAPAAP